MNKHIPNSIENIFDESTAEDSFVVTHEIQDTPEGGTEKVEVSPELTEWVIFFLEVGRQGLQQC